MIEIATIARVLRLSINRPEKRNALNSNTCRQFLEAFEKAETDAAVGAVLICGNGSAFCAGMDLEEVLSTDQDELVGLHECLFTTIERARKPIVAAVQGAAIAAGMGLAANAHVVIAGPEAQFALTEIRIGLWPVIVFRAVARAIGERRATELSLTGRTISADEAFHFGLVTQLVPDAKAKALDVAQKLSGFSPVAMATGLEHIARTRGLDWTAAGPVGREMRAQLMAAGDFREGVDAFLQKRPADWPSLRTSSPD